MLKGIVSGEEKDIVRIPMRVGNEYKEGWEVRDNHDRLIWGREDELQTTTGTLPFKGYGLPLKVKSLLGNAVQTGTPTPDNPIMPTFCGVRTAQLIPFPYKSTSGTNVGVTVEVSTNGRIKATGTTTGGYNWYLQNASASLPAGTYTVSFVGKISGVNLRLRDVERAVQVAIVGGEVKSQTFTLSEDCSDLRIYLNIGQTGVDVDCDFVAMLNLGSTALPYEPYGWAEKITCAGQTTPVYLGQTPTVRRVKKLVFDGSEPWGLSGSIVYISNTDTERLSPLICTHFPNVQNSGMWNGNNWIFQVNISNLGMTGRDAWIAYLQQQHAAGHPVTVWYVLATPETAIVNEPLAKIGDYADELNSTVATLPEIPTTTGQNTLTVDTTLAPSSLTIKGHIKEWQPENLLPVSKFEDLSDPSWWSGGYYIRYNNMPAGTYVMSTNMPEKDPGDVYFNGENARNVPYEGRPVSQTISEGGSFYVLFFVDRGGYEKILDGTYSVTLIRS